MILVVGATKGGVGKTTLAINLTILRACAGSDVLLVDGDEQGTALAFTDLRNTLQGEAGYSVVALQGTLVRSEVPKLATKYDDLVIDVGGRDTASLRAALTVADRVIIPVQPRSFDVWAVESMAELVAEARSINPELEAVTVLNAADAQGRDNDEAATVLLEVEGLRHLPQMIGRRKAFPNAATAGRCVVEQKPLNAKAIAEITALADVAFATRL